MVTKQKTILSLGISKGLRALHRLPVIPWVSVVIAILVVFQTVTPVKAADGIRKTINFQGKLVDNNGLNVANGSYTVVFTLYNDPSAGSNLWDETQSVSTVDGVFQVELGTVDTTLGNVNFNSDLLYLGIKVGADAEMTPRIRFTAVPYAFNAQKVNGLNVTNLSGNPFSTTTTLQIGDGKTVAINNGLTFAGTDSTTITFQGTDTYVGRTTTDTLINKTIGSTGLIFSGAGTDITTGTNEDLTFLVNGSGDLVINTDFNSGVLIGSASNTQAPLSVSGGIGSNAAFIVNQTNAGDLFVASAAGTTRFRVANTGDVVLSAGIYLGGSAGTGSQCLLGGATASWGSCGSAGLNPWTINSGLLYNGNLTTDVAFGGTSSTSAKFLVGMSGTRPTASVSANTASAGLVVDNTGLGDLFTASKSGATKFVIDNAGNVRINNLSTALCDVKADTTGLLSCGADWGGTTNPWFINFGLGVVRPINNTMDLLLGGDSTSSAKFAFLNMNNGLDPIASFTGTMRLNAKNNATVAQQTTWTSVSNAAGQIDSGGTTLIASISAMASYNGSIYAGTFKGSTAGVGEAEVYRYDGTTSSWTKVSGTAGTMGGGATTNIASVSAMTVFDGRLYVGTSKVNQAEIYRYEGGSTWTKVSAPTAGTINVGGTANIDGVSSLAVFQGRLYAGTREPNGAELYRNDGGTTWTKISGATAGQFVATNTVNVSAVTAMVVKNGTLYIATSKPGDADILKYLGGAGVGQFLAMNALGTNGSYTVNGTPVTLYDEITSMNVYNGNVILGMRRQNNQADVLMLNDIPGEAGINTFTRLNNAAGQMTNGGTASIDVISAMTIYGGMLFVGTSEGNGAEIYRYTGGEQKFFKVSQTTAGTIASGGRSGIDGIASMIPSNGDMYIGTMELGAAELYKYTASIDRSYGLEFHANPQIAGGEQSSQDNHASIFYLASASANLGSSNGNTGAFVFSHGIQTRNGSYDVAEDYPTRDDSLEPGDVISIDSSERGFVKKSQTAYEYEIIGVYSEKPALRLSQEDSSIDGAHVVPVALAGRVPVKVSTENGAIKAGDFLTASSKPGVAMRATKSGVVIGQAMGGYNEEGTGKVIAYIKSASYLGSIAQNFANLSTKNTNEDILAALATQAPQEATSEMVTDKLVAGLSIVSPEITATNLQITTIEAAGGMDIGIVLSDDGTLSVRDVDGKTGMVVTHEGDAYFAGQVQTEGLTVTGTLTADKLIVNEVTITPKAWRQAFADGGLETRIANLETFFASSSAQTSPTPIASAAASLLANIPTVEDFEKPKIDIFNFANLPADGFATFSGKLAAERLQITGSAIIEGMLHVVDFITTRNLIVNDLATFLGKVVFSGEVFFENHPTFNNDTAGIATVKKGTDRVEVHFEKSYETVPMVNVNLTLDEVSPMPSEELASLTRRQEAREQQVFNSNVRYIITKRTTKGFIIVLDKKADDDITFSWIVVAVDKPLVHEGNGDNYKAVAGEFDKKGRPISSSIPTIIPTSSIEKREQEILPSPKELLDGKEVSDHDSN